MTEDEKREAYGQILDTAAFFPTSSNPYRCTDIRIDTYLTNYDDATCIDPNTYGTTGDAAEFLPVPISYDTSNPDG